MIPTFKDNEMERKGFEVGRPVMKELLNKCCMLQILSPTFGLTKMGGGVF